ncbi:hypothetical protein D5086_009883 [Populus alba]|uniref:Uncharacterized protein n=1 Tax=Populus alba TaxID=43335 RepID=A0ACC4C9G5_POPAL
MTPMTVQRNVICDSVKELMRGDQGKKARERAQELGRKARQAVEKGGSSEKKLDELIECLTLKTRIQGRPADPKAIRSAPFMKRNCKDTEFLT